MNIIAAQKFAIGGPLMGIPKADNEVIRKPIMHKRNCDNYFSEIQPNVSC